MLDPSETELVYPIRLFFLSLKFWGPPASSPRYHLVPPANNLGKTSFEAEFWEVLPRATGASNDGIFPPTEFTFALGPLMFGLHWPLIEDERTLTVSYTHLTLPTSDLV